MLNCSKSAVAYVKSTLPTGVAASWHLEKFEVPVLSELAPMDTTPDGLKSPPGEYTRLRQGFEVFMTDLLEEWYSQKVAIEEACERGGQILITGLGLGLIVESILLTPHHAVEKITVLELSGDVIQLVAPHLLKRYPQHLEILQANAFTWSIPRDQHYTVIWHDIWPNPMDPQAQLETLQLYERYRSVCDWQGSWVNEFRQLRQGKTL